MLRALSLFLSGVSLALSVAAQAPAPFQPPAPPAAPATPVDALSTPTDPDASPCGSRAAGVVREGGWFRQPLSDTVIVFVHGIMSDSRSAWLTKNEPCAFWPALVADDAEFGKPGIYLGGFFAKAGTGSASIKDLAAQLFAAVGTQSGSPRLAPIAHRRVVFVAHSLGGIVVRRMLLDFEQQFAQHQVALVLYASPAGGSPYADVLGWLETQHPHILLKQLKTESPSLVQLNEDFKNMLERRKQASAEMMVVEYFESRFPKEECNVLRMVVLQSVCSYAAARMPEIVPKDHAGYFAGEPVRLPDTDHLTIVKPTTIASDAHRRLVMALRTFRAIPSSPGYAPALGRLSADGKMKAGRWENAGPPQDFVTKFGELCAPGAPPATTCDELKDVQQPYRNTPGDGDEGFVILRSSINSVVGQAAVNMTRFPSQPLRDEAGRAIHTALALRQEGSTPSADGRLAAMHTITVQPLRFRVGLVDWKPTAVDVMPTDATSGIVEFRVPPAVVDADLIERSVAGEARRKLSELTKGMRLGLLEYREKLMQGADTVLRFDVRPRTGEIR